MSIIFYFYKKVLYLYKINQTIQIWTIFRNFMYGNIKAVYQHALMTLGFFEDELLDFVDEVADVGPYMGSEDPSEIIKIAELIIMANPGIVDSSNQSHRVIAAAAFVLNEGQVDGMVEAFIEDYTKNCTELVYENNRYIELDDVESDDGTICFDLSYDDISPNVAFDGLKGALQYYLEDAHSITFDPSDMPRYCGTAFLTAS